MSQTSPTATLSDTFNACAARPERATKTNGTDSAEKLYPVSFRVTASEKKHLKRKAGKQSLSAYMRDTLLGDYVEDSPKRPSTKPKARKLDALEAARLLSMFGQSELATHVLALSMLAQSGELDVTPEVNEQLARACDDIEAMKGALLVALGMRPDAKQRR